MHTSHSTYTTRSRLLLAVTALVALLAVFADATTSSTKSTQATFSYSFVVFDAAVLDTVKLVNVTVVRDHDLAVMPATVYPQMELPYSFYDLPEDSYTMILDVPGYYKYTEKMIVNAEHNEATGGFEFLFLVPITTGVSILRHFHLNWMPYFPNMTFPNGAFSFPYATLIPESGLTPEPYNWGAGVPPSHFSYSPPYLYGLSSAKAGTYQYYLEVLHYPDSFGIGIDLGYNFNMSRQAVSVYGGIDRNTGHKVTLISPDADAKAWHVGNVVVTNPAPGCSRYLWKTVDQYSSQYGFSDGVDHGTEDAYELGEYCYDISAPAMQCTKSEFPDDVATSTCGVFGDPHIVMFNGTGVSCGVDSRITLVDNAWFSLTAETYLVSDTNLATEMHTITLSYKSPCNPITIRFREVDLLADAIVNAPNAFRHGIYAQGNNIYIPAIHLRLQVRIVDDHMVFGLSMPSSLLGSSTGICTNACPAGTELDLQAATAKRSSLEILGARSACADAGLAVGTWEYDACVFDVATSGIVEFANSAVASKQVIHDVSQSWTFTGEPAPTGAASSLAAPCLLLLIALCLSLIMLN